jgi:hypothetical protein
MMLLGRRTVLFALQVTTALANTEKVIFLAPNIVALPDTGPPLQTLRLDTLSPANSTLQKALPVAAASPEHPRGRESWYLLQGLNVAQRYEVRICWPAVVCLFFHTYGRVLPPRHSFLAQHNLSRQGGQGAPLFPSEAHGASSIADHMIATHGLLARDVQSLTCV